MSEATPSRYWQVLGLSPGCSLDELEVHYSLAVERFPANPTEDQERECDEIRRAYGVLRRACQAREAKSPEGEGRSSAAGKWGVIFASIALSVASSLFAVNLKSIQVALSSVGAGTEIRIKGQTEPFGTVIAFEREHRFPAGKPGPAYRVRLASTGEEIWVGERVVELGMER